MGFLSAVMRPATRSDARSIFQYRWFLHWIEPMDGKPILNCPNNQFEGLAADHQWLHAIDSDLDDSGILWRQFLCRCVDVRWFWTVNRHCFVLWWQSWRQSQDPIPSSLGNRVTIRKIQETSISISCGLFKVIQWVWCKLSWELLIHMLINWITWCLARLPWCIIDSDCFLSRAHTTNTLTNESRVMSFWHVFRRCWLNGFCSKFIFKDTHRNSGL